MNLKKALNRREGNKVLSTLKEEGISKNRPDSDFDRKALSAGIKVELEHAKSREVAKEIAKDHLVEDPNYYDRLKIMEGEGKYSKLEEKIMSWFKKNPNPTDKQVHSFANKMNINEHKLEEIIYKLTTEHSKMVKKSMTVKQSMKHSNILGAGAKKRKKLKTRREKFNAVMKEFERGTLHSGSGEIVTDRDQALAIAYSESGIK